MTTLENIRLCDNGYGLSYRIRPDQKIKLRKASRNAISTRYTSSFPKKELDRNESSTVAPSGEDTKIEEVVILHPILAEMYKRVENGKYRVIKVRKSMYDNITAKGANVEVSDNVAESVQSNDVFAVDSGKAMEHVAVEEPVQEVETSQEDVMKVSRNGAFAAKVEKYMASFSEKVAEDENHMPNESDIIPPTVIEEENARPVSIVVPERVPDEPLEKKDLDTDLDSKLNPENITSVVGIDLGQLKDYLAKITELKRVAEAAREREQQEKEAAEQAEQEAVTTRDALQRTAEELAAHQQSLIEQTEASQVQAGLYAAKRDEYIAERDEYAAAINDMLAVMGNESTVSVSKGRGM